MLLGEFMTEQQLRDIIQSLIAQLECDATNLEKGMSKSIQRLCARDIRDTLKEVKEKLK